MISGKRSFKALHRSRDGKSAGLLAEATRANHGYVQELANLCMATSMMAALASLGEKALIRP